MMNNKAASALYAQAEPLMGQEGLAHSLNAPNIGAKSPLFSHIIKVQ